MARSQHSLGWIAMVAMGLGGSSDGELVMPHLLTPIDPYKPTYNLSQSTMIQTCQKPGGSLDYLKEWGVVSYDWSNNGAVWHSDHPNDCDRKMLDQAAAARAAAPNTKIWIYRNLAQAYAEFGQIREKLEDPAYAGWFLPFGPNNDESVTPRCSNNSRGKRLCSDLFHWQGQRPGGDCGDKIPCGWYQWDHRNESLREWIINEFMLGDQLGLGNASVDGFLIDDWWSPDGPSEVQNMENGTGLAKGSQEFLEIYGNWSITTWQAQKAIVDAGGFTWNNVNCMLDVEGGFGGSPVNMTPCGLVKTEGYPRANNTPTAPTRPNTYTATKEGCASWLRTACQPSTVLPKIPILMSFTRNDNGNQFPLPAPLQDIATFLLVRGPWAWMGYGWLGCTDQYERPDAFSYDFGVPADDFCHETSSGSGIFTRKWSKATVTLDCGTYTPNITVSGHGMIPVPAPPHSPSPAPPGARCPAGQVDGYTCQTHRCNSDASTAKGVCGPDLCYPIVKEPALCMPLPQPLEAAAKEAAARCTASQDCSSFGIDTDVKSWSGPPGCLPTSNQTCAKFFSSGAATLDPVADGWWMWVKK